MITEATINTTTHFGNYTFNPNVAEWPGMDLDDWKAHCAENGYTVEENTDIDGRLEEQDGGKIFKCSLSNDEFINVVVWESAE